MNIGRTPPAPMASFGRGPLIGPYLTEAALAKTRF